MRKKIFAAAAVMTLLAATPVFAGTWQQDQVGWYYTYDTGGYAQNTMLEIDGAKYYFDANGYMVTGWVDWNGKQYYCSDSGAMLVSTFTPDGFYVGEDGARTGGGHL